MPSVRYLIPRCKDFYVVCHLNRSFTGQHFYRNQSRHRTRHHTQARDFLRISLYSEKTTVTSRCSPWECEIVVNGWLCGLGENTPKSVTHELADKQQRIAAAKRKARHDVTATESTLAIGDFVYIRDRRAYMSRTEQDQIFVWSPIVHVVIGVPYVESNVYVVIPATGSKEDIASCFVATRPSTRDRSPRRSTRTTAGVPRTGFVFKTWV